MMKKHVLSFVFLAILILPTFWYTAQTASYLFRWAQLDGSTTAKTMEWIILHLDDNAYRLQAKYVFEIDGQEWKGEAIANGPTFPNPWAAERNISFYKSRLHKIWYAKNNPKISAIEKTLPSKRLVSTLILWGIVTYFLLLDRYLIQRKA